jgi:hypothetical protein
MAVCITTTSKTSQWNNGLGLVVMATSSGITRKKEDAGLFSVLAAMAILKKHAVYNRYIVFYPDTDSAVDSGAFHLAMDSLTTDPFRCSVRLGSRREPQHNAAATRATTGYAQRVLLGKDTWLNCTPIDATAY